MPRIVSKSCNSKGIRFTFVSYPGRLTPHSHIHTICFYPISYRSSNYEPFFSITFTPFPILVTILLVISEWVAPNSNTSTLILFISSVPATTSDAALTSSRIKWKTLHGVWSFCSLGLSWLEFAPDWEDLTGLFMVTDCWWLWLGCLKLGVCLVFMLGNSFL